jgi:hypothetical protein
MLTSTVGELSGLRKAPARRRVIVTGDIGSNTSEIVKDQRECITHMHRCKKSGRRTRCSGTTAKQRQNGRVVSRPDLVAERNSFLVKYLFSSSRVVSNNYYADSTITVII